MLSDIEIAQSAELKPIAEIANQLGISADELEFYGKSEFFTPCHATLCAYAVLPAVSSCYPPV